MASTRSPLRRGETRRTVLNRQALGALEQGFIGGMAEIGRATIAATQPPDAEPYGQGLITTGDWVVYAGGKKVAGRANKPRGKLPSKGIVLFVGFDFPARFNEQGTIHQQARPFLTPAMLEVTPEAAAHMRNPVLQALHRVTRP